MLSVIHEVVLDVHFIQYNLLPFSALATSGARISCMSTLSENPTLALIDTVRIYLSGREREATGRSECPIRTA